jgi:hypothetical protein
VEQALATEVGNASVVLLVEHFVLAGCLTITPMPEPSTYGLILPDVGVMVAVQV